MAEPRTLEELLRPYAVSEGRKWRASYDTADANNAGTCVLRTGQRGWEPERLSHILAVNGVEATFLAPLRAVQWFADRDVPGRPDWS